MFQSRMLRIHRRYCSRQRSGWKRRSSLSATAIAGADRVAVRLDLLQGALGPQHLDDALARRGYLQAVELRDLREVHPAVQGQDAQDRQVVPLANVVVGGVVLPRHL